MFPLNFRSRPRYRIVRVFTYGEWWKAREYLRTGEVELLRPLETGYLRHCASL